MFVLSFLGYTRMLIATSSPTTLIDNSILPALITAIGGIVVGIVAANRASRSDKIKADAQERAEILKGYGEIVKSLQEEIERVRREHLDELSNWDDEKEKLKDQIRELKNNMGELKEQTHETRQQLWYYQERERKPGSPINQPPNPGSNNEPPSSPSS